MSAAAGTGDATAAAGGAAPSIIDDADFERMRGEMATEDEKREILIKRSREALKASKNSIYDLHRGSIDRAKAALATAKELIKTELLPLTVATPSLRFSLSGALEEYAESFIFACYLTEKRIPAFAELEICSREEYLGGLMDAVGELNRYAVLRATARDLSAVQHARETVDQVHHQLMLFDWRNGNLRRKYDGMKYTLKKLEQIIYELTLSATGFVPKSGGDDAPPAGAAAGGGDGDDDAMDGGDGGDDGDFDGGASSGGGGGGGRGGGRGGRGGSRGAFGGRGGKRPRIEGGSS